MLIETTVSGMPSARKYYYIHCLCIRNSNTVAQSFSRVLHPTSIYYTYVIIIFTVSFF